MVWTLQKWDTTKLGIIWSSLRMGKFTSRLGANELKSNGFFFWTIRSWIAWVKLSVCFNYLSENFIRMNLKEWRDCQIVINCGLLASPKWRELSNIMMGLVNQVWFFFTWEICKYWCSHDHEQHVLIIIEISSHSVTINFSNRNIENSMVSASECYDIHIITGLLIFILLQTSWYSHYHRFRIFLLSPIPCFACKLTVYKFQS